jgi:hypothetical protein
MKAHSGDLFDLLKSEPNKHRDDNLLKKFCNCMSCCESFPS